MSIIMNCDRCNMKRHEKVLAPMFVRYTKLLALGWVLPDDMIVVWWCYPPKEIEDYDKTRNN